jgi:hypothetical protein
MRLGDRSWSNEDVAKLKDLLNQKTFVELAQILERTPESVRSKCRQLGLKKKNPNTRTSDECRSIVKTYETNGIAHTCSSYRLTKDQVYGILDRYNKNKKKVAEQVSELRAVKFRCLAIKYARAHFLKEYAEDFASFCILRLYTDGIVTDLKYLLIDFKRETFGSNRTGPGRMRMNETHSKIEVRSSDLSCDHTTYEPEKNIAPHTMYELLDSVKIMGDHRACFLLYAVFGFDLKEISLCFGFSKSRACQLIAESEAILKKRNKAITHD